MPISSSVRITRMAISPRLATKTLLNTGGKGTGARLFVRRRVGERRLVAAPAAEGVLDRRRCRALLGDVDLETLAVVTGDHAGDGLLSRDRLGDPHRHLVAHAEPPALGRVIDLDGCCSDTCRPTRLEGPRELLESGPASFAGIDSLEGEALLVVSLVIEVEHEVPRRAGLVVVVARDEHNPRAAEIDAAGVALDDRPRQRTEADTVGRTAALPPADPPARAYDLAVARLEVRAGQAPVADLAQIATSSAASATRVVVTAPVATGSEGSSFSAATRAATRSIQPMLIAPSARSTAISAQQQPPHHRPRSTPMRVEASGLRLQWATTKPSGCRQRRRQALFAGVSSYTAATRRTPATATGLARSIPAERPASRAMAITPPNTPHASR